MVIKGFRVGPLLRKTAHEIDEDNVGTLAASAAYNFFFSLFPLLLFLAPLLSLVGNRQHMVQWLMDQLASTLGSAQFETVKGVLEKFVFASGAPGLVSIGTILAAWSGSNIFGTLMGALNTAYDVRETRSWIKQQIVRLVAFVAGIIIVVLSTAIFLEGGAIASWIGNTVGLGSAAIIAWKIVQYPIALAGLVCLAFLTFYFLPNVKPHAGQAWFVSVLSTVLWVIATLLFRLYLAFFPPSKAYGLIGGIIILLTWMYFTMFLLLACGELASELHHGTGAIAPDKGAIYLGRIVTGNGPGSASVKRS